MTEVGVAAGWVGVITAIIFFGSFAVPLKSKRIAAIQLDPMVNQLYMMVSIFVSNWLSLAVDPDFEFSPYAIAAAALWVPGNCLAVVAIKFLGLGVAQGVWSGLIMLISFIWGAAAFGQTMSNVAAAICGLVLLCGGAIALGLVPTVKSEPENGDFASLESPLVKPTGVAVTAPKESLREKVLGALCCAFVGICAGTMMVPARFNPNQSINYLASFGIGIVIVTPVVAAVWFGVQYLILARNGKQHMFTIAFHPKEAAGPCLLVGLLWSIGNAGATLGTMSPLGLTVGYPLTQVALLVSGLWSILLFREVRGTRNILHFMCAALVVLAGAVLLAVFG
jgi:glucose uptake protein GlcU